MAPIVNTKKSYCYLAIPGVNGIYYRRYLCLSCKKCKLLKFLECTNEYCGPWQFHAFNVNQKTLEKLFKDAISPFLSVIRGQKQKEQAFKNVMKLIGKYYCHLKLKIKTFNFYQICCQIKYPFVTFHSYQKRGGGVLDKINVFCVTTFFLRFIFSIRKLKFL